MYKLHILNLDLYSYVHFDSGVRYGTCIGSGGFQKNTEK